MTFASVRYLPSCLYRDVPRKPEEMSNSLILLKTQPGLDNIVSITVRFHH